jgi:hypothetical protein
MSTNYKYNLLFLFILLSDMAKAQPCLEQYGQDCAFATLFYETHRQEFEKTAKRTGLTASFLFAIVAPELTQYSYLRDKVETYSLKVFYVQNGKSYSDFSIGFFQMKPSFIERMEDSLQTINRLHEKFKNCLMSEPDSRKARVERVQRLSQLEWQFEYLALFCELVRERFPSKSKLSENDKLIFYAAAYNTGFHKSEALIEQMAQQALFPHFLREKYRYSDIALCFYRTVNNK